MSISPGGRNPLSRSSFDSYPTVCGASAADEPAGIEASEVWRQNRRPPSVELTVIGRSVLFDMNRVPLSAFSGLPPSAGGVKRGSRQVPVHCGDGSILPSAQVSL